MNSALLEIIFTVGGGLFLLLLGLGAGAWAEKRHYASIREREEALRTLLLLPVRTPPDMFLPCRSEMVCGSVVIGTDYFKRFAAKLRNLVGGRVVSYESLVDRARREAVLRMKQEAKELHANCILNVKFSTANVMSGNKDNNGSGCIEVIVYGTALIPA